jgi:type III pantothenate kinase
MLLAIDSGNTNIVFAVFGDDGEIKGTWRANSKLERTKDEHAVWLRPLLEMNGIAPDDITHAIIATVVPSNRFPLVGLCRDYFGIEPLVIGDADVDLGIKVLVDRPEQVGADRLVNTVAAHAKYGGPLIIVDFGTATTFDVIDGQGSYMGGVISPGINLSLEALHQAAAKLPLISVEKPDKVIGRDTVTAMQSGVFWGYVGLIEGIVRRIRTEMGADCQVIATGGLAPLFLDVTPAIELVDRTLTLDGLYMIHRNNAA